MDKKQSWLASALRLAFWHKKDRAELLQLQKVLANSMRQVQHLRELQADVRKHKFN